MREYGSRHYEEASPWESVQLTKEAIHARLAIILYAIPLTAPFVALVAVGGFLCGLKPHEVLGVTCHHAMITVVFCFDTLRNSAHHSFHEAEDAGLVTCKNGIPVLDPSYPHRRLASLSFAVGGRGAQHQRPEHRSRR